MIIGFTAGAFDLAHAGHMLLFQEAKQHCDYLIVGLQVDPSRERIWKAKPVERVSERYLRLKAIKYIDEVIPYETEDELVSLLFAFNPQVRFVDESYRDKEFTGKDIEGITIHYVPRRHDYSSTNLRKRLL